MRRKFNITGSCNPQKHYMVNLDDRLKTIKESYVDEGSYFVINRGRQYGKTTTLAALERYLQGEYTVLSLDFQMMATEDFANAASFSRTFSKLLLKAFRFTEAEDKEKLGERLKTFREDHPNAGLNGLFECLSDLCAESLHPIVLMIDEVDSASNNQVFVEFLAMLRGYYLMQEKMPIFHSVILAGLYDIKNLKLKLRPESEHQYNSPWNIAAKFKVAMDFSVEQIAGMLQEYEADFQVGMDVYAVAEEIYAYTDGYPVLVSSICKCIDEELSRDGNFGKSISAWSRDGIEKAVEYILKENSPLFESMVKQLDTYPELCKMIEDIIYRGKRIPFSAEERSVSLGAMFGFLKEENGHVAIANRIFEMCLLNMFIAREAITSDVFSKGESDRIQFIKNNRLDMDLVLEKFVAYFHEIYGDNDEKFIESYGRKFFLLYLKPIINGTGNYYLEAQTRDARRTDVIVDYLGEQFIVELKIWHGNEYNERGEKQLTEYLDYYHKDKGYMLSFNFNKKKEIGLKGMKVGTKTIVEAVV